MQPDGCEYLVNHGKSGAVGRFVSAAPLGLQRGDRVVVRSRRGLEVGTVLCPANARHARLLVGVLVGELLRSAGVDDDAALVRLQPLAQRLFDDSRRLVRELDLPAEVLDVEVLLDGRAVVQHVQAAACDWEPFVAALGRHGVDVLLEDLALPAEPEASSASGCGEPNCGRAGGGGGCSTCGSGGGCSSCGSGGVDLQAYFAHLRDKMEQTQRTSLL